MSAGPQVAGAEKWRVLLLTCRSQGTDFRRPLAEELQALGHEVTYAFVKRRPTVIEMAEPETERHYSLPEFLAYARREFSGTSPLLVFNSTNLVFPGIVRILRALCGGLWCFDMHDNLIYELSGWTGFRARMRQKVILGGSDFVVYAPPMLRELYPDAHHLANASQIRALDRPAPDWNRVLILASIDARFDFPFVTSIAKSNPSLNFDIFGHIWHDNAEVASRVTDLTTTAPNVRYCGPYVNGELPDILARYPVTFAPYQTNSILTYFIDPLRYYHCLNSGMEVISTDIPKARDFADTIHIIHEPEEFGPLVERLRDDPASRRNVGSTAEVHNWRNRAVQLMDIAARERARRKVR